MEALTMMTMPTTTANDDEFGFINNYIFYLYFIYFMMNVKG